MKMLTSLSVLFLMSCGQASIVKEVEGIDAQLQPIVDSFRSQAHTFGLGSGHSLYSVRFGETGNPDFIGVCKLYWENSNQVRTIVIKHDIDPELIPSTTAHELGHCLYDLPDLYDEQYSGDLMFWQANSIPSSVELTELIEEALILRVQLQTF